MGQVKKSTPSSLEQIKKQKQSWYPALQTTPKEPSPRAFEVSILGN
ncbi:hypothetical protein HHE03_08440 [Helicobacter heilmannii]|nr:hypothetical protein HHE03_08440 [Helicobacter heilmannii]